MRSPTEAPGGGVAPVWPGLAVLLVVAGALRVFAWSRTSVVFNDGPIFLAMAEAVGEGRFGELLAHPYHPLYPLCIWVVQTAFGLADPETAAVAVSIAGGVLSVAAIHVFVRHAFDPGLAWLAAWTVALHPWAVDFSSDVMSDGLYAGLYLSGFAALARLVERPTRRAAIVCGAFSGLAYLTRPEGVGLVLCGLALLAARAFFGPAERRRTLHAAIALSTAAALFMAPLMAPLVIETGELRLTRKKAIGELAAGRSGLRLAEPRASAPAASARSAIDSAGALSRPPPLPLPRSSQSLAGAGAVRPPRSVIGVLEAFSRALRTSLAALRYEVALFACLGIGLAVGRKTLWRDATLGLAALLYSGVLVLLVWGAGYVARRHALAALLPLVGYAAFGWRAMHYALVDRVSGRIGRRPERGAVARRPIAVLLGLLVALSVVWGPRDLRARRADRAALREAAEWLAQRGADGGVAAQKLRVAYYAGAPFVPLPSGRETPIEAWLRAQGARWVVIDARRIGDHLGLEEGVGVWLERIHQVERAGHRAVVLELSAPPARP